MPKVNAMLVVLNEKAFKQTLPWLNFDNVNLVAAVTENGSGKVVNLNGKQLPLISFAFIHQVAVANKNLLWLICGFRNSSEDLQQTKDFLMLSGIPEMQIVNFELFTQMNPVWVANLRHTEQNGVDAFATGPNAVMHGLDLNNIYSDKVHWGGCANLAETNQDLRQSFLTAKHIFQHVKRGRVKFVFIGLTPYSLHYDNRKDFSACTHDLQYALTLNCDTDEDEHGKLLQLLISNQAKSTFVNASVNPDLNFDSVKAPMYSDIPVKSIVNWQGELQRLTKTFDSETVAKNLDILKSYIKLCADNGAKPVGVMLPFAPAIKEHCDAEVLALFRMLIRQLEESHGFTFIDLFDLKLEQIHFSGMDTLNRQGEVFVGSMLKFRLFKKKLLTFESLCAMHYESFDALAYLLPKETYNELLDRVLDRTVKQLRHKKKIKVGFLAENAANWCGDKLYDYFARNERFEPTIFLVMRADDCNEEIEKDFRHGIEQFKSRGLNVVGLEGRDAEMPTQDILFFLKPYLDSFPIDAAQFFTLTPQTLIIYIPYGFNTSEHDTFNKPTIHVAWKLFLESLQNLHLFEQKCIIGAPRALYSGYPRLDVLFEEKLDFDWKMTRPDAKKIIWAPHWSMGRGINYATFQWNYKFMYEFAKAHPEISWVVKPHPKLPFTAVATGLFPSVEAYREYIQKWNDLPNAKVYTGAYYHNIFATSDGMIMDCGSFIAEYQYTHKPMIFLTRDTQRFNDLGKELMQILYRVDGRDLKAIAALMQKIFIDGKDELFDARMKFFDENMNYIKANGMTATEFIFKTIAKELRL